MNFSTTPLATDIYSRFFTDTFDEREVVAVSTGFQAFFGRPEAGGRTLYSPDAAVVDIDIIRANERLAALIPRGSQTRTIGDLQKDTIQTRFSNINRVYPLIEEMGNIDANQLLGRMQGENPFSGRSRTDRLRMHAAEHHKEHVRRTVRTFEYLSSQSILLGTMPAILGTTDANLTYDFLRAATHNFTPTLVWTNASSTPLVDLDEACRLIRVDGHAKADMVIFGEDAINAFIKHATVQALADNRRFELIRVSNESPVPERFRRFVDGGMIPRGRLITPKGYELWLFSYNEVYTDSTGTATDYMPVDDVIVASSYARCDRYFGPPEVLPNVPAKDALYQDYFGFSPGMEPMPPNVKNANAALNPAMFYFDAYTSENYKRISLRTQAAPIFATTQTDAFCTLETVV